MSILSYVTMTNLAHLIHGHNIFECSRKVLNENICLHLIQGIYNPNHNQDIPCLKLIMHAKQQPQMQNKNIGMEEEEAVRL